jgi:MFS family permease
LVQILTAPLAILIDAVSFVFSALLIGLIRTPEPEPARRRRDLWNEIAQGTKVVADNLVLRAFAIAVAISSLGGGLFGAQYSLFALKGLGFKPGILGMIYGVGGISSLLGALMAERISNRLGAGRSMVIGLGIFGAGQFLVPMARGATWLSASLMIGQQLTDGAFIVYFINQTTLKQTITPNHLLGRVNATLRFAMLSSTLAGSLLSGLIAQFLGLRMTLGVGAASTIFAALWLSRSPVWAIVRADGSFAATFCATD